MTDTAINLVPKQGKLHRLMYAVFVWLQALEYTSLDYTNDRIYELERKVAELTEKLRASRS